MARVPFVQETEMTPRQKEAHAKMKGATGNVGAVGRAMLHTPVLAERLRAVSDYNRFESKMDPQAREIVIITVGVALGSQIEVESHSKTARKIGVREEVLQAIKSGTTKGLLPKEAVYIDFTKEVMERRVKDSTFQAVEHLEGRQSAIDLIVLVGYYTLQAQLQSALGIKPGD